MLTWETLTECTKNGCLDDDLLLICQLLRAIRLLSDLSDDSTSVRELFIEQRKIALATPIKHYQALVR